MRVGWGQGRVGRLRGGAHSLVGTTDPAQMGQLRNNTRRKMAARSGNLEPLISDRGLGWAGKAATLVGYQESPLQPWPGHPPAVGDDDNTSLAELRWAALTLVSCLPPGIAVLPVLCSCPHQMLQEEPCDTSTKDAFISIGSSVSSLSPIGDKR